MSHERKSVLEVEAKLHTAVAQPSRILPKNALCQTDIMVDGRMQVIKMFPDQYSGSNGVLAGAFTRSLSTNLKYEAFWPVSANAQYRAIDMRFDVSRLGLHGGPRSRYRQRKLSGRSIPEQEGGTWCLGEDFLVCPDLSLRDVVITRHN
jgi:hypothetical protein